MTYKHTNTLLLKSLLLASLFFITLSCGKNPWEDYSAAISIRGEEVKMKIYGSFNGISQWDKVKVEILDRVINLHYPKKVLIVVKNEGEERNRNTAKILKKVTRYLQDKGLKIEVRDDRK